MKSTNEAKFNWWWLLIGILVIVIWICFPFLFNKLMFWMTLNGGSVNTFASLGPIGDIYGSLNTLFTSATLAIVVYSTLLQRQANQDAKDAMAEQLQQAKDNAKDQLKQAHELVQEQIKETKNSFFTSQFYALLNYKNEKFKELLLCDHNGNEIRGQILFRVLAKEFFHTIINENKDEIENIDRKKIRDAFNSICKKLNAGNTYYELFTYFEAYSSLIELVESAPMSNKEKRFFWSIIRRSISGPEQRCLFLIAPMWDRVYIPIKKMAIFNTFAPITHFGNYALKFYDKKCFALKEWQEFFENHQTPT